MNKGKRTPRLLGAAFLIVLFLTFSEFWALSIIGTGGVSDSLARVSSSFVQLRIDTLLGLILSTGIVVLAVLLFVVLHRQNKTVALVALGWWLLEAFTLVIRQMSIYALLPLAVEYTKAGAPDSSHFQTLGALLLDVGQWAYDVHMWFFCLGGLLWYVLFLKSKGIPRALSLWGIVAVSMAWIGTVMGWFGMPKPIVLVLPNGLFELAIGLWLVIRGIPSYEPASDRTLQ
jgi:hypothetical protein